MSALPQVDESRDYGAETDGLKEKVHRRLKECAKEQHRGRTDAVLELKANTEKAFADLCGKNEKRNAEAEALARSQDREFQDLLTAGKNPYEVFRAREIATRAAKKLVSQKKKIKEAEMAIAAHMVHEAALSQKRDETEKRHAEYVRKYQKELGRKVVEGRTRDYMISRTGAELVDPTGRTFRIDPSQVTVMKDHSFGLGKSTVKSREQRDKVIDMIAAKREHANVQINPRGLPKTKDSQSVVGHQNNQTSGNELEQLLLPPIVDPPGMEMAHLHGGSGTPHKHASVQLPSLTTKHGATPPPTDSVKKGFGMPKRSKLEENMRLQALAKQKENRIEKQIVWRKEFVGRAFLADPEVLWFKDFDVGRPQTLAFTLTNVSNTFNHFKLLPFPDDIRDFFDVKYDLPGRMSAGVTCRIHVTFCARVNQDINVELPAVAKTGYFSIPVKCTTKRTVPVLSSYHLTFTNIVVGETSKQVVTLRNDGALPATFRIVTPAASPKATAGVTDTADAEPNAPECIEDAVHQEDAGPVEGVDDSGEPPYASEEALLRYATSVGQIDQDRSVQTITTTTEGRVESYGSCTIGFTFAPFRTVADIRQTFQVVFDSPNVDTLQVTVNAQAVEVPLYVEAPIMDFKCCVYGKLYRSKLILRNRGKVAMKCQLKVPPYLQECLEFLPNFGFVQGSSCNSTSADLPPTSAEPGRFEVQLKFRPTEAIWTAVLKRRLGWKQGNVVAIPLQVLVPDQVLPVYFVLRVQLTSGNLLFSLPSLSFGACCTTQSVSQSLVLTNPSRLPQKFGFVHVPPEIRVEPNDGFGTLLPLEQATVTVFYSPLSATEFKSTLTCATTLNRTYQIPCVGQGMSPALRFSEAVITMGAIPLGQFVVHSVVCTNSTATSQKLEIALPPEATKVLHVRPLVATIDAHSSIRIEFEFRPTTVEPFEAVAGTTDPTTVQFQVSRPDSIPGLVSPSHHDNEAASKSEHSWRYDLPAEPKSYHGTYNIVCFVDGDVSQALQSIRVNVAVIDPEISSKPEKIEFGQVAVGQTGVMKLQVINNSAVDLDLKMVPLHSIGPFSILNALRVVSPHGGLRTMFIEFAPSAPLIFREDLVLQSTRGNLRVSLHGEGVSPVLSITPADGKVDFKPVLAREKGYTEFSLLNSSLFPLKYIIKSLDNGSHPNFNQTSVFTCIPNEASIPPGETQVVRAIFSPDHERPMEYTTTFRVDVPNQTEDHVIVLKGRCWECQSYILHPDATSTATNEDVFDLPLHVPMPLPLAEYVKKPSRVIHVEFGSEPRQQQVVIGSIGPHGEDGHATMSFSDGKASTPTTFEIVFDTGNGISLLEKYRKHFVLEPLKGTVSPGHETSVCIQFNPCVDDHDGTTSSPTSSGSNAGSSELRILHWIRVTARVTLKGGYIPPVLGAVAPEQVVQLVLKARVFT
ncbi:hypothetical protein H310_00267 [Aphanomyces invadans]|uniref:Abnormal spindle-like microcephaly-associated protein ASH domain-containing protein n=1 Tax=Aphanomyces invadans TaxID=157072 RepID=A0A024UTE2_9STRA|nr:hypothetical protein H310_00267 [Aphanomyces invadans]ETW09786.1 hypothetical protein H310_00267 [Aphanomyces invadans]|eukprot:XP_008861197.1 hypothetical protein H310_00267 [Aphanomyces invadans]